MDDNLCGKFISSLIDPGSTYIYVNPELVDKCGLKKKVYVESWLVQLATSVKKRVHH